MHSPAISLESPERASGARGLSVATEITAPRRAAPASSPAGSGSVSLSDRMADEKLLRTAK